MNSLEDDPDFSLELDTTHSTSSSLSSNRLLRSACHHGRLCREGHGLQFNSRISPSPSHSSVRRRRRRLRHQSGVQDSDLDLIERPSVARRDLTEDFARVERTSGWVANLHPFTEKRTLNLVSTRHLVDGSEEHFESTLTRSHQVQMAEGEMKMTFVTPQKPKNTFSSTSTGSTSRSPRLKFFDGEQWKRSPRTGYTYVHSPTYRYSSQFANSRTNF